MRGVVLRTWRAMVALDLLDRILFRDPATRIERLESRIRDQEYEIELLKDKVSRLRGETADGQSQVTTAESPERSLDTQSQSMIKSRLGDEPEFRFKPAKLDQGDLRSGFFSRDDFANDRGRDAA
ncbi:MAG: hypothetical protein R3C03_02340 [Pirellulaceae bacterium]